MYSCLHLQSVASSCANYENAFLKGSSGFFVFQSADYKINIVDYYECLWKNKLSRMCELRLSQVVEMTIDGKLWF